MGIQYRKRIRLLRLGPLQTFLNVSLRGVSATLKLGRLSLNSRRGASVDGPGGWTWRQ